MHKVFVYGTLKNGHGNFGLLRGAKPLGKAVTSPKYTMVSLGAFPAVQDGGETAIHGEVYEVDSQTIARLDQLEGHPNWYHRELIPTEYGDAWIYLMDDILYRDERDVIKSGVWQ